MELGTEYIRSVSSWDSGGGITVDIVELSDGRVLGITDESVVLYPNMEALESGESDDAAGVIALA
ncbi:hypothetical protein [Methylomicrobium lacus]|uniref:hypothetical protein n=1 Tax=Methylomicrobium lacus TaxID=136992 RepID=UPI0035A9022D